ncbi:chemotaxis protein CheD [Curvibacter sp. CHRR-16]|uniref:chemotaxis protein CheD n=1 Tax=Curvibacter sp. CHRR-16 TaxID=2835872 RepID=UPI001BD99A81|nr:chemotaxis protein CheD [Curvibacter sp. CHRR-16]MBT0571448.1 chemotaxis protein CheD [Curvibacter sp. CHRR-16]
MSTYDLMPGDVVLAHAGDQLRTLLGSCVSLILTDPRRTVGCMCHIVHASRPPADQLHNTAYGSVALQRMQALLLSVGITPRYCHAYAYGGGNMFASIADEDNVSLHNVLWLQATLQHWGMTPVQACLGGRCYRKLSWVVGSQPPQIDAIQLETA